MNYGATLVVALLLVGGCSHAKAKPTSQASALAPKPGNGTTARSPQLADSQYQSASTRGASHAKDDETVYFDFNSAVLKPEARPVLREVGEELRHNHKQVRIEGNCDERGTTEYNLALGERRAREAKQYLERLGIPGNRISVVTYGSERPKALGHDEAAWAQNRRDDFEAN
jgi:peptidoglycan-associated lipoprotein